MNQVLKYFPQLSSRQQQQLAMLGGLYADWNSKINLISRKDIDMLYLHHVLHSLAIAKIINFVPQTRILDVGTGGGFPGIPLAIMFPECSFKLVDSIGKKVMVVNSIVDSLGLHNVKAEQVRAEMLTEKFDFVVSRAVADLSAFVRWVWGKITPNGFNALPNGILYLKGGDLSAEIEAASIPAKQVETHELQGLFSESYFETKKLVYIQR